MLLLTLKKAFSVLLLRGMSKKKNLRPLRRDMLQPLCNRKGMSRGKERREKAWSCQSAKA